MIYLTNTTSAQTVSIPRNDNGGTPSINPRSYQEGYNAGEAHQKSLLSSTAITENGEYQSENGFSAITVDVPTGISIDLSSITITANTAITETEKAYTGITVNVPQSGYTQQDLDNAYTSGYTNGYTSGEIIGYSSGYSSGKTDGYASGETSIINTFTAITATTNGAYGSSAHPLSSITVNVPQTGSSDVKYVEYIQTDGSKYAWDTGYAINSLDDEVYLDFMPLTGTPQGDFWFCYVGDYDETNILIRSFGNNPNQQMGVRFGDYNQDEQSAVTANYNERSMMHLTKSVFENITSGTSFSFNVTSLNSARNNIILNAQELRNSEAFRPQIARYYGFKVVNGNTTLVDLKPALDVNDNPCFYDEVSKTYIYHTGSGTPIAGAVLPSPDYQSGYTSGYTDGFASGYSSGYTSGYTSGSTDGYNDGYTSGETSIINTFTAITATTNGVYGSTGHPLSSITVNVPQTAITSDVKYVDYIEINTSGLVGTGSTHWIFTDNIGNQSRVTINFDFMPLASNASGMHKFINGPIYLRCDKPISNKKYNLKINGTYYRPWDGIVFSTDTRYNCYFSTETNVNNTAYVIINGNYFEVEYTDSASAARVMLNVSEPINQGETFSTTTGRYYGIKVTSGSTILVDARPALDNNNNPCFYDIISNSYIYHTGNSVPVAGNLLSLEEVFNRYYDYGYNTGYASGYTSGETNGYASGYSSGYTSGETVGYIDCSKNSIIGYRIGEVLLSRIQSISSDTLTIFMDIILPYDDYAVFPFSYSASTEKYVELGYFQNYLRVEGNITNDEVDYYFTNPTPAEGRRVICQININPLINNRINVWLYDFVDGQGTYGVLSANSIINLNQLIRIQSCNFNELKIIKNGELIDDFRYNGNGKIVDVITGIEYGEDITPYNPYSSN